MTQGETIRMMWCSYPSPLPSGRSWAPSSWGPSGPVISRPNPLSRWLRSWTRTSESMKLLLLAVPSISLLVGGIGIMNILLVSVTERTREIGIRMAVGAKRRHILLQFLVEAVVLSAMGGMIGVGLGVAGAQAASNIAGWPTIISADILLIAFGFSALVGIFFGLYPANKASQLNPIEALRYE